MKLFLIDLSKSKLATSICDPDLKLEHGQARVFCQIIVSTQ
jgi:hypothetical protein